MRGPLARLLVAAPWLGLAALASAVSLQKIRTFDYWWHLRTGRLIAETGAVPKVDPFTFTAAGNRWIDVHWLHQLGLYGVYALGGHTAVVFAKLALVGLLLALLAPIGARRERPLLSVAALSLMLLVACDRFMPRPELPTFVCLAGVLFLLDRFTRKPDAGVYGVVAIQLVWANVHGLFALGVVVCAIYLAAELARPWVVPGASLRPAWIRRLAAVTALGAAAALVNPNGLEGALYPIQQLGMIGPTDDRGEFGALISELLPPFGSSQPLTPLAAGLFAALAGLALAGMAANWRRLQGADPLLWVAFLYLALGAQRNLALFAIVAAPVAVRNWNEFLDARRPAEGRPPWRSRAASAALTLALLALAVDAARGTLHPRLGSTREPGLSTMDFFYPVGAVDWIERHRPEGRVCHHMADGGYLIWRLYPDYPVLLDGRLEVFGEERFTSLQYFDPEEFRRVDAEVGCGIVLVHYSLVGSDALLRWLHLNSNWQLTFVDDVAALFVRVPPSGGARFEEVDLDAPDLFAPLPDVGIEDRLRRFSRVSFLTAMHRNRRALELWKQTIALYPELPQADTVLAALLYRNGFAAAAEAIVRRLLDEAPHDPLRRARVGDLRFEAGDLAAAQALYDEALRIEPNHPYALLRRAALAERMGDGEFAATLYLRVLARFGADSPPGAAAGRRLRDLGVIQ